MLLTPIAAEQHTDSSTAAVQRSNAQWQRPDTPWVIRQSYEDLRAAHPLLYRAGTSSSASPASDGCTGSQPTTDGACSSSTSSDKQHDAAIARLTGWGKCVEVPCSLLVVVPGIGGMHMDEKVAILLNNIRHVEAQADGVFASVHWHVYSFGGSYEV